MSKKYLYKFLDAGLKSHHDGSVWGVGKWRTVPAPTEECVGLNASEYIQHALGYVQGTILARVECGGKIIKGDDKWTCEKMRIVAVAEWTWRESVGMAVFAARRSLPAWEKEYPKDDRVRLAIDAADKVLVDPSKENLSAASAAASAASAARSAAWSAESAAWSARSARSAAWSAESAAWSAESAAWSAESAARSAESAARSAESAARSAESARSAAAIHRHAMSLVKWRKS